MSPNTKDNGPDPVVRRLDAIIALLVRSSNPPSIADQIRTLDGLGLEAVEIGKIVGKPSNYVSASLGAKARKKRPSKKRR